MRIKWFGTAAILIEEDGTQLLFDPFIPLNNKIFKPDLNELALTENILITHGHFDHMASLPDIVKHGNGNQRIYCTNKPRDILISMGIEPRLINKTAPGDTLDIKPFTIRVLKGRHIIFDKAIILKTLFNPRNLIYRKNLTYILKNNKKFDEAGETAVYEICTSHKRVLLLGSLNLDNNTEYPKDSDLLILPFQGRTDINKYALTFMDRLLPKKILLDHFDDTFPPVSSNVSCKQFMSRMREKYPDMQIIYPKSGNDWIEIL
ncbi:MAG: MBL fold metallo-hydrolase [Treponema sp.]|jgi:L-ascorbate metabolism protein UlaG (beta-lactamase superfamily)|nr:MBL fold metallo-hydrolase [Treponema sp.]